MNTIMGVLRKLFPPNLKSEQEPQTPVVTIPAVELPPPVTVPEPKEQSTMANPIISFFGWLKHFFARPGLTDFLNKYKQTAIDIIERELAALPAGGSFHDIADNVWKLIKEEVAKTETNPIKDNWISGLVFVGLEFIKALETAQKQ